VRVNQQLTLTLSPKVFTAYSVSDTLGPTVTLADRRGNGLPGASIRFVPAAAFDSAIVKVTPPVGVSNPATGAMAAPRLVSAANGFARVFVLGIGADGFTIVAADSVFATVRQVARRVAVEPLRAVITGDESIPIKPVARDARGAIIPDATIAVTAVNIALNGNVAGPTPVVAQTLATIAPSLSGVALPAANPGAPQVPVTIDTAQITIRTSETLVADTNQVITDVLLLDSLAQPAFNKWVRFGSPPTLPPDSVQADGSGMIHVVWMPREIAGTYTLTGVRSAGTPLNTLEDSAGRIVIRRRVTVVADTPSVVKSSVTISTNNIAVNGTALVTIRVNDGFNNPVLTATSGSFTITPPPGGGTLSAVACSQGVCTTTYTAPAAPGNDTITVKMGGVNIVFSPISITIF
jgi:hypothetical protein